MDRVKVPPNSACKTVGCSGLVGIAKTRGQGFAAQQHRQGFQFRPDRLAIVLLEGQLDLRQQLYRLLQLGPDRRCNAWVTSGRRFCQTLC